MADCTSEQKGLVEEILKINRTEYYKILKVDKKATDIEIKKSYRKLAIKLHPDKNKHPKASEAFKVIAKAFEVLGDESKRKMYDVTGSDPDSRGGMGGAGAGGAGMNGFQGFQGFQGFPAGNGVNLNEDLFNMFFGSGPQNGFSFNFGGNGFGNNGFYYTNPAAGMNARRRAAQQQQQQRNRRNGNNSDTEKPTFSQYVIQLLPIIVILFSLLLNLFSNSDNDGRHNNFGFNGKVPHYSFKETRNYNIQRSTPKYHLNYYINEKTLKDFEGRENFDKEIQNLDKFVEINYINKVKTDCQIEKSKQQRIIDNAQGVFFNDYNAIKRAENMELPNCKKLEDMNFVLI